MSVQANMPVKTTAGKKGGGGLGGLIGGTIGGVVGAIYGGPAGAAAGWGAGSSAGGMVGGLVKPAKAGTQTQGQAVQTGSEDSAGPMTRRLKSGETQQQLTQLKDAAMAATSLPPPERAQYLEPIMEAAGVLSQQRRQV